MKHTDSSRKTVIRHVRVSCLEGPIWEVVFRIQTGLLQEEEIALCCASEREALKWVNRFPIGSELPPGSAFPSYAQLPEKRFQAEVQALVDSGPRIQMFKVEASLLPRRVLVEAKVFVSEDGRLSRMVRDQLGAQRLGELESKFLETSSVAAAFEYCTLMLPRHSAAFVAACCLYMQLIAKDGFSAGYLQRDLEQIVDGVEQTAVQAIAKGRNAGAKGREASVRSRKMRIETLLSGMEDAARRNPDIVSLGAATVAELGVKLAAEINPDAWRQGRGQLDQYLGEIRRGEAGTKAKARYDAIFGVRAPKRT